MRVKLVRDNSGPIRDGCCSPANSLPGKHMALLLKIYEETDEIARDATDPTEYADLLEALFELARINGVHYADIVAARDAKREAEGGFRQAMIWSADIPVRPSWPKVSLGG